MSKTSTRPHPTDFYGILGVSPTASQEEIAAAYRAKAASVYQSRRNGPEAEYMLRLLNAAYEVLRDPVRRTDYDRRQMRGERLGLAEALAAPTARSQPRLGTPRAHRSFFEVLGVVLAISLGLYAAFVVVTEVGLPKLSSDVAEIVTGIPKRRVVGTVPAVTSSRAALPLAVDEDVAARLAREFSGSTIDISNRSPVQYTDITLTLRLVRNGQPVEGVPVSAVIYYKTVVERHPRDGKPVKTNKDGVATIKVNIGPASAGYTAVVHMVATYDDYQLLWETDFTPLPPPTRAPGRPPNSPGAAPTPALPAPQQPADQ